MKRRRHGRSLKRRYGRAKVPLKVLEKRARKLLSIVRSRGGRI